MKTTRFNYIKYDDYSTRLSEEAKGACEQMEGFINSLGNGRAQSLALTHLEEMFMWIGKAIRDLQISKNGSSEHIAERSNS